MNAVDIMGIVAGAAGVAMALSPMLQVRRMLHSGDAQAVSVPFLLVLTVGASIWLAYGLLVYSWPLIVANSCNMITSLTCALIARRMHRRAD